MALPARDAGAPQGLAPHCPDLVELCGCPCGWQWLLCLSLFHVPSCAPLLPSFRGVVNFLLLCFYAP